MGQGKGIAAMVIFVFFTFLSIAISFDLGINAAAYGIDSEIAIVILVECILLFSTTFLIPGIFCLLGKQYGVAKWYYALIPVTLLWILIYTMVVAILAPTSFISNFIEFLGLGIGGSVVLAIIVMCMSYEKFS